MFRTRFLTALCCLVDGPVTLVGDEAMAKRPIQDLVDVVFAARDAWQAFADELLDAPWGQHQAFRDVIDVHDARLRRFSAFSLFAHKTKPKSPFLGLTLVPARARRHPRYGGLGEGPK